MIQLWETLVLKEFREQDYWPFTDGITSTYFLVDDRMWLNLVTQKIQISSNTSNVTYPWDLVMGIYNTPDFGLCKFLDL